MWYNYSKIYYDLEIIGVRVSSFSEYEKMSKSLQKLGLSERDCKRLDRVKWVVTEKVHGANFSFIYEDGRLKFAKRRDYLKWQDDFFGFQLVAQRQEGAILKLFERLAVDIPASRYIIYGELFGGEYPHNDVEQNSSVNAIQTGIYYSPDIEFYAFDIAIVPENGDEKQYLDYKTALSYLEESGILYAKPLFIGKLTEALAYDIKVDSYLPRQLNLPAISGNLIEGVVIKPYEACRLEDSQKRPIIKLKNPRFDEQGEYHQAQKWSYIPDISSNSEELGFLIEELKNYLTTNRLQSAISKVGQLEPGNRARLAELEQELLDDCLTDFDEDNEQILGELSEEQLVWIRDRLRPEIKRFLNSPL